MSNYKWEREKRGKYYIPPLLSDKDDFVPETHIGMYRLLTNPKDPAIYMSEAQCQKLRHETFDTVNTLYKKYGSPDFQIFWNYNLEAINELGMNKFGTHSKILPVIGLIECFEKKMKLKSNGHYRYIISFGIDKERLKRYFYEVRRAKQYGGEVPPPKLVLKRNKTRDLVLFGEAKLSAGGGRMIIDKNAIYNQFSHWCSLNGVTKKTGATMALKYFIENHPIDGIEDLENYDVFTEFDKPILAAKKKDKAFDETIKVKMDGEVLRKANEIIKLYNRDVANIAKETLTLDGYANNAFHLLNQNMPLKYRDKELYEQKMQLELMEKNAKTMEADNESDGFEYEEDEEEEE